ncbi:MAG: HAD hydrolase-like protein [Deltaproteobacteria bacterium]|nr:HAD hydrolase-like protein [Deltaproteobacteria bacterium]
MTSPPPVPRLSSAELVARYDVMLLDSYGVLVDEHGPLAGAAAFLARLDAAGRRWMVLSNDASRLPETSVARYQARGLPITADRLMTSGDLIGPHFAERGLAGRRCVVLGPSDSHALVEQAGGVLVPIDHDGPQVVVICDDAGYPFRETIETLVSTLYARIGDGHRVDLVLPNPDLVYPSGPGRFALTAGSVARLVEEALALRWPDDPPRFVALGKPHRAMFAHAQQRLAIEPSDRVVMVGDQLATDVAGALSAGLDAVLVATGVGDPRQLPKTGPRPTAWMPGVD